MGTLLIQMVATGLAVGKNKGHIVAKKEIASLPKHRKGKANKHNKHVRSLVREVLGFNPYEKRCMELLKVGKEKRVLRVLKNKIGDLTRAKAKREELSEVLRVQRMKCIRGSPCLLSLCLLGQ